MRVRILGAVVAVVCLCLAVYAQTQTPAHAAAMPVAGVKAADVTRAARRPLTEQAWINRTLARMTIPEEVGQLFEVNGYGSSVRDRNPQMVKLNRRYYGVSNIAELIKKYHLGGIIYFDWTNNFGTGSTVNLAQVVGLSNGIQRVAMSRQPAVPMVISTDQEEGEVLRMGAPATVFPGNMPLGATRDTGLAQRAALITGQELRAVGINVDNAPVTDVNLSPLNEADGIRSYGDQVGLVSSFGVAQVKGYQTRQATTGVGATAKHFPGFGDATANSDFSKVLSPQNLAQVKRLNFPSMKAAFRAGVDRVMVTHILFPKITGRTIPSSMSRFWITGMLRNYLHYNGPVVTDALDAAAVAEFSPQRVALSAFDAGADELLEIAQYNPPTIDKAPGDLVPAYNAVLRAVRTHKISKRRLDQSVIRILRMKWKLGLVKQPITNPNRWRTAVGTPQHKAVANTVAQRSIMLLKNSTGLLPLAAHTGKTVLVTGFGTTTTKTLGQDIAANGLTPTVLATGSNPTSAQIAAAVAAAQQNDLVVDSTFNAWTPGSPGQINLFQALLATGKPVIVAAVGTPYDVAYLPGVSTFITSVGYQPVSLHPLVQAIFGQLNPTGKLPVTITQPPPSKAVLYPFGYGLGYG
jgi:beta-N-acetylhexosaminidase